LVNTNILANLTAKRSKSSLREIAVTGELTEENLKVRKLRSQTCNLEEELRKKEIIS
jgi:hypothetical protein